MSGLFEKKLEMIGMELQIRQKEQFQMYYEMLIDWNKKMNLTAITEYEEVYEKHFVDSIAAVKVFLMDHAVKVIDIGTGAGFPGIPLKIMFPHLELTLLDSLNKRVKFLDAVIKELQLENVQTLHGRAEDYARKKDYREQYDLCVSRAVANLATLSEYCLPFVCKEGYFISYKSGEIENELSQSEKAVRLLGGEMTEIEKFALPGTDIQRSFVKIKKVSTCSIKYPRKAGLPSKEPLL